MPEQLTVGSLFSGIQSAASISASSAPGCELPGTPRSSRSPAQSCESTGRTSRTMATFDLFEGTPWSPSTCCAEASHARTSASPARARASKASAAGSGANTPDWCGSSDPVGSLLRTSLLSELEAMTGSRMTWRQQATPCKRSWSVLTMLERRTDESACGSLPTPIAGDGRPKGIGRAKQRSLTQMAERGQLPTPTARDWRHGSAAQEKFPRGSNFNNRMAALTGKARLNPQFVAWMMGFPPDFCDIGDQPLPRSATRSSRKSPKPSGAQSCASKA